MRRAFLLLLGLAALGACGDSRRTTDGGIRVDGATPRDAGPRDAGPRDAGLSDASAALDGGAPRDSGEDADTSSLFFDDACGAATPRFTIAATTTNIMIDTRAGYSDRSSASCGALTPGADAFLAIDGRAGERWHVHLAAISTGRRPMLFVTSAAACGSASCAASSDACDGSGDEHIGFVLPSDGLWYVGVDDAASGGGLYTLSATRSSCGDGAEQHGEGCDDGNLSSGDGCDASCRVELSTLRTSEFEPNEDHLSANALVLPASGELEITGSVGGPGACTYHDVFAIRVPAGGDVAVDALESDGAACASGARTPFELALEDATGARITEGMRDTNGCATLRAVSLPAGEHFVHVEPRSETGSIASYRLRFRITP